MLSKIKSFGIDGINGYLVEVEVDLNNGLPAFLVVGLPDASIKESKERVCSAIKNSGLSYPANKIVINLAPADTKKEGPMYDLPIAVGILAATHQVPVNEAKKYAFLGELSLDGNIRKINGVLPILISAREAGYKNVGIPIENAVEASFVEGLNIYAVSALSEVVRFLNGHEGFLLQPIKPANFESLLNEHKTSADFKYVKGQFSAKRALEIAAAGGHNIMLIGPPGSGKTMLAKCIPTILPELTFNESLETTKIHSIAGVLDNGMGIIMQRPFRTPHHTATLIALTGGGAKSKPGEISLAHNGVLFLDEMPEYSRACLETLRQPLEDGKITIARANQTVDYPANFMLVASMNPCPCGYFGSRNNKCKCTPTQIMNYLGKLSGPLMDRIDLHIEVDNVSYDDLTTANLEESSDKIKSRVDAARKIQLQRFEKSGVYSNAKMSIKQSNQFCKLDKQSEEILKRTFEKLQLSARAYSRILRVARTIADLDGSENIKPEHISEATVYRSLDRRYGL